jgi:hypothetical protein
MARHRNDRASMSEMVESRMGAVAWGLWPTPRFPSHRVTGGGRPPPVPTERGVRLYRSFTGRHARLGSRLLARLCRGRHRRRQTSTRLQGATLVSRVEGWRAGVARGSRPTPRRRTQRADFPHCAPPFASRQSWWDLSWWGNFRPVASHSIGVEQP